MFKFTVIFRLSWEAMHKKSEWLHDIESGISPDFNSLDWPASLSAIHGYYLKEQEKDETSLIRRRRDG